MARINKVEQARRDAMDYAYRLVKKEGIEALEKRVDRNRKTIAPAFVSEKAIEDFTIEVKANCVITFTCAMAMILRDKYGFGNKRMSEFITYFYDICESIDGSWLTFNDIIETIKEETGVDLSKYKDEAVTILEANELKFREREKHGARH